MNSVRVCRRCNSSMLWKAGTYNHRQQWRCNCCGLTSIEVLHDLPTETVRVCIYCRSSRLRKAGHARNKQRYECVECLRASITTAYGPPTAPVFNRMLDHTQTIGDYLDECSRLRGGCGGCPIYKRCQKWYLSMPNWATMKELKMEHGMMVAPPAIQPSKRLSVHHPITTGTPPKKPLTPAKGPPDPAGLHPHTSTPVHQYPITTTPGNSHYWPLPHGSPAQLSSQSRSTLHHSWRQPSLLIVAVCPLSNTILISTPSAPQTARARSDIRIV